MSKLYGGIITVNACLFLGLFADLLNGKQVGTFIRILVFISDLDRGGDHRHGDRHRRCGFFHSSRRTNWWPDRPRLQARLDPAMLKVAVSGLFVVIGTFMFWIRIP